MEDGGDEKIVDYHDWKHYREFEALNHQRKTHLDAKPLFFQSRLMPAGISISHGIFRVRSPSFDI